MILGTPTPAALSGACDLKEREAADWAVAGNRDRLAMLARHSLVRAGQALNAEQMASSCATSSAPPT